MLEFKYKPITNARQYSTKRRKTSDIKFIVIHDTANSGRGANAMNHFKYLQNAQRYGSAHYYVDDCQIIQTIGDSRIAWSVGDTWARTAQTRRDITNDNSLNVELCVNSDGDYDQAFYNLVELTKNLMAKFNVPIERVVRHYDASGKNCPRSMSDNGWAVWKYFKAEIQKTMELKIDLDKDSVAEPIEVKEEKPNVCPTCGQVLHEEKKEEKEKEVEKGEQKMCEIIKNQYLNVLKTDSKNIYQAFIGGTTLRKLGAYGINGTFFNTVSPHLSESIWSIAVNNGAALGPNAYKNHPDKNIKRGTLCIDHEGKVSIQVVNNISEISPSPRFAVGGLSLIPKYDPDGEKIPKDILRRTYHTAIGYKDRDIYLITSKSMCDMIDFKRHIEALGLDGAVALDGGGSTEFYYDGVYQGSGRKLASVIGVRKV
ncbi:N-acetylmuramoyl-L-alanine amidase [Ezakiella peruensis]|uniref:N-acetylmuramoyl-L-alanine amidase n=1 Tax=Ezakiella peruensis TaxID=1464038 RepID=UPI000C1B27FE|nr:N-acetylmuramoyl-L-alanine amidase [Ezakiella peruensis]